MDWFFAPSPPSAPAIQRYATTTIDNVMKTTTLTFLLFFSSLSAHEVAELQMSRPDEMDGAKSVFIGAAVYPTVRHIITTFAQLDWLLFVVPPCNPMERFFFFSFAGQPKKKKKEKKCLRDRVGKLSYADDSSVPIFPSAESSFPTDSSSLPSTLVIDSIWLVFQNKSFILRNICCQQQQQPWKKRVTWK